MKTTRKYITTKGETRMFSLTIGISSTLELQITNTRQGLQHGKVALVVVPGEREIAICRSEVRATADAFALLADLLDAEEKND